MRARWTGCLAAALFVASPLSPAFADAIEPSGTPTQPRAQVPADYSSIFAEVPALAGSGWSECASPIAWSADTRGLRAAQAKRAIDDLRWALNAWAASAGLTFEFRGRTSLRFDEAAFSLTPVREAKLAGRHIYFTFIKGNKSALLQGTTKGLGSPSTVVPADREIIAGTAIFQSAYIERASSQQARSLYMHEIGHVLGLAHAEGRGNIMYPTVSGRTQLGPGDIAGVHALGKPCRVAPPVSPTPAPADVPIPIPVPIPVPSIPVPIPSIPVPSIPIPG